MGSLTLISIFKRLRWVQLFACSHRCFISWPIVNLWVGSFESIFLSNAHNSFDQCFNRATSDVFLLRDDLGIRFAGISRPLIIS